MTDVATRVWYLGNQPLVDPTEGTRDYDALSGTYGTASGPLVDNLIDFVSFDDENDMMVNDDNSSAGDGDGFRYDIGASLVTEQMDSMTRYQAALTFTDGSTETLQMWAVQTPTGETFLLPNSNFAKLSEVPLQSVTLSDPDSLDFTMSQGFHQVQDVAICFAAGTRIATPNGPVAVETLAVGDLVHTLDHGPRPIRWVGTRYLDSIDLGATPGLHPIRIRRGALGEGVPRRDLVVSPQHRMLVRSRVAERMFGANEALVAAKHLLCFDGVETATDLTDVTYVHIRCDAHEIVLAEGAPTETLYLGVQGLPSLTASKRLELAVLFPDRYGDDIFARRELKRREGLKLSQRCIKNGKALVEAN